MKTLLATCGLLASTLFALVAPANPVTGWVSIFDPQNNTPRFVGTTATTNAPVTTDAHQDCIVANFPAVTLADGDSITFSGTASFDVPIPSTNFRVGLFSGGVPRQDVGNPFVGLYTEAATTGNTSLKFGDGTHGSHPFGDGTVLQVGFLPNGGTVSANTPVTFTLTIARDGNTLDVSSGYTDGGSFNTSGSVNNLPIRNTDPGFSFSFNTAGFLMAGNLNGNQGSFSNLTVTSTATNPYSNLTDHLLGVDFNCNSNFGSPSQSRFRIIAGPSSQAANSPSYTKTIGGRQVTVSQPGGANFEFRGANGDSSRDIPGGDISIAFLVADFIATRNGALDIAITNLPAGDYVFRSYHLEPFNSSALGFAQGSSTTTPNTIEARISGVLKGSVQPTALGPPGLNTTFLNDSQVPTLAFPFTHHGLSPLTINLTATETNGANSFLLLNGFELFQTATP